MCRRIGRRGGWRTRTESEEDVLSCFPRFLENSTHILMRSWTQASVRQDVCVSDQSSHEHQWRYQACFQKKLFASPVSLSDAQSKPCISFIFVLRFFFFFFFFYFCLPISSIFWTLTTTVFCCPTQPADTCCKMHRQN